MSKASITITSKPPLSEIITRAVQAEIATDREINDVVRRQEERFLRFAFTAAPKKTGKYAASIRTRQLTVNNGAGFEVLSPSPLGKFIQGGTRPHIIRAKNARFLRFYWPKVGRVVYFKSVNHPGTRANPFMDAAYRRWRPGAQQDLSKVGLRWTAVMKGQK
jgi:hypothetical protein